MQYGKISFICMGLVCLLPQISIAQEVLSNEDLLRLDQSYSSQSSSASDGISESDLGHDMVFDEINQNPTSGAGYQDSVGVYVDAYHDNPYYEKNRLDLIKAYNNYATDLLHNGEYTQAIYFYTQALNLIKKPEEENEAIIRENLCAAYFKQADVYMIEKKVEDAVVLYEKGVEFDPSQKNRLEKLGVTLYNLGVQAFNDNNYDKAKHYLTKALKYRSQNAYVYRLLGSIQYFKQELDEAEKYWKEALKDPSINAQTSKEIKEKLEKLEKEKEIEKDLALYRSDKFIIRYDKDNNDGSGYKINEVLRNAYRVVGRDFNYYPDNKITVIVYNNEQFNQKNTDGHGVIRAMYDGKIRLPTIDNNTNVNEFKSLVFHEYTHALVYQLAGAQCPTWLNEGLAQYEENKIIPISIKEFRRDFENGNCMPMEEIFLKTGPMRGHKAIVFYQQSYTMVDYLIDRYRIHRIVKILNDLKKGKPFVNAFEDHTMLTSDRFDEKWQRSLKKKWNIDD